MLVVRVSQANASITSKQSERAAKNSGVIAAEGYRVGAAPFADGKCNPAT
jgi:hypothetical protein